MEPYESIKGEMLVRAMDDENINLEHFRRLYRSVKKTIDEIAKEKNETQKLEAVEKLVYESFWDDGKFGRGFETAATDVSDSTPEIVPAMTNAAASSSTQASPEPSTNLNGIAEPPVLQASIPLDGNIQPAISGLLSPGNEEAMCTYAFDFNERCIPYEIRSVFGHESMAETGTLLDVELKYVIGSDKHIFIVMPRDPENFRENPIIGRQILQDAHAFLVYWHWFVTKYAPIEMVMIAEYWLKPGHSTLWEYHRAVLAGQVPKFDMAAHKRALSYRAVDAQTIKKRDL
ncbi:134dda52-20ca-4aab-b368-cee1ad740c92 [Sclerotinia trifoliorum]|uniref:134dda52-20ca-4aab-b368-cee1ad740c92 n=1 Tax=Sclerotinia trifoliorum TaxID=28548 RepID=A0A8H2VTP4_9HELO|nr:134dda52-20ca-4aab-b368-cee1ad740c92 [Sclerotinia trifoliorum]